MSTDLIVVDVSKYALMAPESAIIRANLAGEQIAISDLPKVKNPSGGSLVWELPPDGEAAKTWEGIIIYWEPVRAYYASRVVQEGAPPTCHGIYGSGGWEGVGAEDSGLGGHCLDCPYDQWGTAIKADGSQGGGKACKEGRQLLVLTPGGFWPIRYRVPVTSLKAFKQYMMSLTQNYYQHVLTRFGLVPAKSSDGTSYAQVTFTRAGVVPAGQRDELDKMLASTGMKAMFAAMAAATPEGEAVDSE